MMRIYFCLTSILIINTYAFSQGLNHTFLLGYDIGLFDTNVTSTKARLNFDSINVSVIPESRKLAFDGGQANISDKNGNLLISTNGCWIANANNDTMLNGSGLNPGLFASSYCFSISGIPYPHSSVLLPWPGDSTKYILFHQTGNFDLNFMSSELYYSVIDIGLDSGLGGVIAGQKNLIAIHDTLNEGMAACKHANGRDWWIVILKDSTDIIYKILLTPNGISSITTQSLGVPPHGHYNGEPAFSNDGNKFAYHYYYGNSSLSTHEIRLFNFDRCTGNFSNGTIISTTDPYAGFGLSFSPDSKYLYFSSFLTIYQINTDTSDIQASLQTVALNDTFYSPYPPFLAQFWLMYLAANGKIYITSGNSVIDIHFINYPDSGGIACDVQQHAIHLPCFAARGNVNHPNYYLGPIIGSVCDSLTGMTEHLNEIKNFTVRPNPSNGHFSISYLLPQNKAAIFEVFDAIGKMIYKISLPPWSTLQQINLPKLAPGIYHSVITSGGYRVSKKIVVISQ
jgi:hypothetical protein